MIRRQRFERVIKLTFDRVDVVPGHSSKTRNSIGDWFNYDHTRHMVWPVSLPSTPWRAGSMFRFAILLRSHICCCSPVGILIDTSLYWRAIARKGESLVDMLGRASSSRRWWLLRLMSLFITLGDDKKRNIGTLRRDKVTRYSCFLSRFLAPYCSSQWAL